MNTNFVFNEGNLDFCRKQYDTAFKKEGWNGVRKHSWHIIFRGKRLDDNGPMRASLIELQMRHPDESFLNYVNETADHLNNSEPRLKDGTIVLIGPHVKTIWADEAFMAASFLARMDKFTGVPKYFGDTANQILNYTKYLWVRKSKYIIIVITPISRNMV